MSAVRERRSMRMVWRTMRLRHVGMAFFWACSMLTFRSSLLLTGDADTPELGTLVVMVSFVANMTTMLAMAAWVENDPARIDRLPAWPMGALVIAGLILVAAAGPIGGGALLPILLGGSVLAGIGYGYFWGSWADCYGRMHPARTSFYLPVTFLVTTIVFLTVSLLSDWLHLPVLALMIPLPLISLACLIRCRSEAPDGRAAPSRGTQRSLAALGTLIGLIIAAVVLSCLFGFMWELTVFSVGSVNEAHLVPQTANLVAAVAMVGLVLYARTRINLDVVYRILLPIIVVEFAILPFLWETNPVMLNIVMSASFGVFDVIIWSMVASSAYDFAVSGYVIGGIVRSISILLRLVGMGIGYLITLVPGRSSILVVGLSIGALYVLVMLGLFNIIKHKHRSRNLVEHDETTTTEQHMAKTIASDDASGNIPHTKTPPTTQPKEEPNTSEKKAEEPQENASVSKENQETYATIAEDFGLTRRETEVLPFLARGRSAKVIAEALFVSESTIRTHIRRILEKTDLHSKQEIIDLIERYE